MPTLQVIVRSVQPNEDIVYDQTIEYIHPSEIPGLYNQLSSGANPRGSYIIFGEIPAIYDNPEVNLYAIGIHPETTFHVTLIGELIGRLERQTLNGDINGFYKDQNTVTFKIIGKQGYHLNGYAPYVEKPTFTITDPESKYRVGIMYKQKVYVPQPTNVVYDIIPDVVVEGETYWISFTDGVIEAKLPGYVTSYIVPLNIPTPQLKDYLRDHSDCDAPIYELDFSLAAVTTVETPTKISGRVFPINEEEVLEVLDIINTNPTYAGVIDKYVNPFDYGTVTTPRTPTGSVKVTLNAVVPEVIANGVKKFLVGTLIDKAAVDRCFAAYAIGDLATVRSEYVGQNGVEFQLVNRYMNVAGLQEIVSRAIVYKEFYLLPAEVFIKGDSGRFINDQISYNLAEAGKVTPSLQSLGVTVDIGYSTEFLQRNCNLRTWPNTEEEYLAIKATFQSNGISTAKWVNIYQTAGLVVNASGGVKHATWTTPPEFLGTEYLGIGFAVNKEMFDKFINGNYNDNVNIGTVKTSISANPSPAYKQFLGQWMFNALVVGDEYIFGTDAMIKPFQAFYGNDALVLNLNYNDPTGLKYVANEAGITLTFVNPT